MSANVERDGGYENARIEDGQTVTRDMRYRQILREQLGANGISLLVSYAFFTIIALLLIIAISVGFVNSQSRGSTLKSTVLVL